MARSERANLEERARLREERRAEEKERRRELLLGLAAAAIMSTLRLYDRDAPAEALAAESMRDAEALLRELDMRDARVADLPVG